jgi:hypothetical protein
VLFSLRKVAMALGSATDGNSYNMLFALKMTLATIDTLNESKGVVQVRPRRVLSATKRDEPYLIRPRAPL